MDLASWVAESDSGRPDTAFSTIRHAYGSFECACRKLGLQSKILSIGISFPYIQQHSWKHALPKVKLALRTVPNTIELCFRLYHAVLFLAAIVLAYVFMSTLNMQTSNSHSHQMNLDLSTNSYDAFCTLPHNTSKPPLVIKFLTPPRLLDNSTTSCWMTNPHTPPAHNSSAAHLRSALASISVAANLGFNFVYTQFASDTMHHLSSLDMSMHLGLQILFRSISDFPSNMPICDVRAPASSSFQDCDDWHRWEMP